MAELILKERLQPSLLDRLTDDEPHEDKESWEQRVLSPRQLRSSVITVDQDLSPLPARGQFGAQLWPARSGGQERLRSEGRQIGRRPEAHHPAFRASHPAEVRAVVDADSISHNAVRFDIEGELWEQPLPQQLYLKTEVDLESGLESWAFEVSERGLSGR